MRATAQQIADAAGARLAAGPGGAEAVDVVVDSRKARPGCLFVAMPGERADGNDFAGAAIAAGASVVAMTREPGEAEARAARAAGAALLHAPQGGEAFLARLASWWRAGLSCRVVGVTGSSGKTTTKEMVAAVLARRYRTWATPGNLNSTVGAPLTVLSAPPDTEAMVVEMGMNAAGEIAAIAAMARPDAGVVTNVGVAHIGLLGSRDNIARAKSELVAALPAGGLAVLWGEDDYAGWMRDEVAAPRGVRTVMFGTAPADDARCTDASFDEEGRAGGVFRLPSGAEARVSLPLPGAHSLLDALAAAAVGDALGVGAPDIAAALEGMAPLAMRQRVVEAPGGIRLVDDSYNANTDSVRMAVDTLCAMPAARRVACLGDMGELGDDSRVLHAVVGAYVAARPVDVLVAVGPLSRHTADAARLMGMPAASVAWAEDAAGAAEALRKVLRPGDAVLVKASRSMGLDAVAEAVGRGWE